MIKFCVAQYDEIHIRIDESYRLDRNIVNEIVASPFLKFYFSRSRYTMCLENINEYCNISIYANMIRVSPLYHIAKQYLIIMRIYNIYIYIFLEHSLMDNLLVRYQWFNSKILLSFNQASNKDEFKIMYRLLIKILFVILYQTYILMIAVL